MERRYYEHLLTVRIAMITRMSSPHKLLIPSLILDRHFMEIPPSNRLLSEQVSASPILAADRGAGIPDEFMPRDGPPTASNNEFEFGVDPSIDPELAMVRRILFQLRPLPTKIS